MSPKRFRLPAIGMSMFILAMTLISAKAFIPLSRPRIHIVKESKSTNTEDDVQADKSAQLAEAIDQVDPNKTSGLVIGTTTSLARRTSVEALSNALLRSLDRTAEATALIGEDLQAVGEVLDSEIKGELERLEGVQKLVSMLEDVVEGKAKVVKRETALLTKLQELKQQVVERIISERLDKAAEVKAELISIELVLSETMVSCKAQLEAEKIVARSRVDQLREARTGLPAAGDDTAVREYGYQGIIDLQDTLLRSQRSAQESSDQVAALQRKIKSAMEQRNELLGAQSAGQLEQEETARQRQSQQPEIEPEAAAISGGPPQSDGTRAVPQIEKNEVELLQQGAFEAGAALFGAGKALVKTMRGEEGVGDLLRESGESISDAARSFGTASSKVLDQK